MKDYPKLLCAQQFVLVDEEGSPRTNLAIDDGGQAAITFFDRNGNGKLTAGVGKDGLAVISIKAAREFPRVMLTIDESDDFKFVCLNAEGETCFQITASSDGSRVVLGLANGTEPSVLLSAVNGDGKVYTRPENHS